MCGPGFEPLLIALCANANALRSRMVVSGTAVSDTLCFVRKRRRKQSTGLFS